MHGIELQLMLADLDVVAVAQRRASDADFVDVGAVEAAEVFDHHLAAFDVEARVMIGDGQIVDVHVVIGRAADGERVRADGNLAQHLRIEFQNEPRHVCDYA